MFGKSFAVGACALSALALVAGCSSSGKSTSAEGSASATSVVGTVSATSAAGSVSTSEPAVSGTITVLAAASLTGTFTNLAKQFESAHPGVTVKLSFGASSALALQINQGAPADVFASASTKNMTQVIDAGGATASTNFVKNVMEIAVPPSNPAKIAEVSDLAKAGVKVALCQAQVPCGATALAVFKNAKISVKPVTLEADVKSTLAKVQLNEVDAGLVYVTDVLAAGTKVKGIEIPAKLNASTEYPIAALSKASNSAGATAFIAFVRSAVGESVLSAAGFSRP